MKKVISKNDGDFDLTIAQGVTLVDFWAPWCGPCRVQASILDKLAENISSRVTIAKVNIDEAANIAERFRVQAIPTLILFNHGMEIQRFIGVQTTELLMSKIAGIQQGSLK